MKSIGRELQPNIKKAFMTMKSSCFAKTETKKPYSGIIKIRSRTGLVSSSSSYSMGSRDGDFFEWHENGKLKSKSQYKEGMGAMDIFSFGQTMEQSIPENIIRTI